MRPVKAGKTKQLEGLDDAALVELARSHDEAAFRLITRRHDKRLYRLVRGILRDDAEAEDVVQETFVRAFTHLSGFRGEARLSTWLTRIALNEALDRLRQRHPVVGLEAIDHVNPQGRPRMAGDPSAPRDMNPEAETARSEIRRLLERAIDELPEPFRVVFVLREIEQMSVDETASQLGVRPETVRTRLHRARRLLRKALGDQLALALTDVFPFEATRCARLTEAVLDRLASMPKQESR
jgi:RNA polymerase sigma-70 factor, ECF subfamily